MKLRVASGKTPPVIPSVPYATWLGTVSFLLSKTLHTPVPAFQHLHNTYTHVVQQWGVSKLANEWAFSNHCSKSLQGHEHWLNWSSCQMHGVTRLQQSQLLKHGPVIIQMGNCMVSCRNMFCQCNSHVSQRDRKLALLDSNELIIA